MTTFVRRARPIVRLALARLPLLILIGALLASVQAAADVRSIRGFRLADANTTVIDLHSSDGDDSRAGAGRQALADAFATARASAVYTGGAESGVGAGVFDTLGTWPGLPFTEDDYRGSRRVVSLRSGSALGAAGVPARGLTGAAAFTRDFDGDAFPETEFVYPLLAADLTTGHLAIEGLDSSAIERLATALTAAGYEVHASRRSSLGEDLAGSPSYLLMMLILSLAWVSATAAWIVEQSRGADRLRKRVLLGATPGRAALGELPTVTVAWAFAAIGSAVSVAVFAASAGAGGAETGLAMAWGLLLAADLASAVIVAWARAALLARTAIA
ncbi:hypothetical protein [Propionicicella superfundia]|uniref:hypothetical protein n=1 Tax=Propionicicella superfundia TaxID=348582 RepID=UPI00041F9109|nr:hypothetical protein [Propionicicella superfundia]